MKSLGCPTPSVDGQLESGATPLFLDLPQAEASRSAFHLLSVPLEATVSYGSGTSRGPRAILEASTQVELYDREFDCEPALDYGIHSYPEMLLPADHKTALEDISKRVESLYDPAAVLAVLGGEHSLSYAVVRGLLAKLEGPITVVQLDAHSDLRDSYEDSPHSHACVARRLLELESIEQILQLGVRSLCTEEARVIKSDPRVRTWFAEDVHAEKFEDELRQRVRGRRIYLTVDVDGFDPSIIPSTGTPEPNGLSFAQGEAIFRILAEECDLVAFDCVELAPVAGRHVSDFVVAKLIYRLMNLFAKVTKNKGENA